MRVIDSMISECLALNGKGGVIFSATSQAVMLSRSTFSNNSATSGGVLFKSNGYNIEFSDSTFEFNKALGSITGGGVGCIGNAALRITNSIFNNNIAATDGGVLDLNFTRVSIEQSLFSEMKLERMGLAVEESSLYESTQQTSL